MTVAGRVMRVVLLVAFLVLAARLGGFMIRFARHSLQMDFAAFYAAGQAAALGLSPYVNHIEHDPPVWDGVDLYRHSRFLYPPLVARLFQPLALLGYQQAKILWMLVSAGSLAAALWLSMRMAGVPRTPLPLLAVGTLAVGFHPVLALLERGQLDSVILLLLLGAVASMQGARRSYAGGAILAVASLLKLHCSFLVPFLVLRRKWRAVAGVLCGAAILLLAGVLTDGSAALSDYAFRQLPRIARYGEGGTEAMRLHSESFARLLRGAPSGSTVMDGRSYEPESLRFVLNASLVRTPLGRGIWTSLRDLGLPIASANVSIVLFGLFFGLLATWQKRYGLPQGTDPFAGELIYWQSVLIVVLLCAPATWAMSTVWLLPIGPVLLREAMRPRGARAPAALALGAIGLALAGLPDALTSPLLSILGDRAGEHKYVFAEILCLACMLSLWSRRSAEGAQASGRREAGGASPSPRAILAP